MTQSSFCERPQKSARAKKFEAQPVFIKAGLLLEKKYRSVRKQDFYQKIVAAELLKIQGTNAFNRQEFEKAARTYEQALSIFRFIKCNNPFWEKGSFSDDELEYVDEEGESSEDKTSSRALKLTLYLNLAMSYLRTSDFKSCREACDEALKIDGSNSKALYRKVKAIMSDTLSTLADYEESYNVITQAVAIEPTNQEIQRLYSTVKAKYLKMKTLDLKHKDLNESSRDSSENLQGVQGSNKESPVRQSKQSKLEKVNDQELSEALTMKDQLKLDDFSCIKSSHQGEDKVNYEEQQFKPKADLNTLSPSELKDFEKFLETRGDRIVQLYEVAGRSKQAKELKEKLTQVTNLKEKLEALSSINKSDSGMKIKELINNFGINVRMPDLKEELSRAQRKNLIEIRNNFDIAAEAFKLRSKFDEELASSSKKISYNPKFKAAKTGDGRKRRTQDPLQRKISRALNFVILFMATLLVGLTLFHHINQKFSGVQESIEI